MPLIGILVAAAFVVILNETTLAVALPLLMSEFNISADIGQWLTTAFMLTMAVVIPMTGYLLERFRTRTIYVFALSTFLLGTIIATLAVNFPMLLFARVVQAIGTALVLPLLMTTITRLVPVERRGSVFGMVTVAIAVAPALGPTFSGLVIDLWNWRWVFGLVVPLVVVVLLAGIFTVKELGTADARPTLDVLSVFLSAIGFSTFVYGISQVNVLFMLFGVAVLAVFAVRQTRLDEPLLDLEPLRSREYVLSLVLMLLTFGMLFGYIVLTPLYAQNSLGLSKLQSGLISLPGGVLMALMGRPIGRSYDAKGMRPLIIPGSLLLLVAMTGFAFVEETHGLFSWLSFNEQVNYLIHLAVLGVVLHAGLGLMMTPLMSNALAAAPDRLASHAQAILNTLQQVAGGVGTSVFIALMSFGSQRYGGDGVHTAYIAAAIASLVVAVFAATVKFDVKRA